MGHLALKRTIRYAEAHDKVIRNVVTFVDTPKGQAGRPSRALSREQAAALMQAASGTILEAYITVSLTTGMRTEEARALSWPHVDLEGQPDAKPPVPPHVAVRAHGETKTEKSRRTLALPQTAAQALRRQQGRQEEWRREAGNRWQETGLVFTTTLGTELDAANVRREFRKICKAAKIEGNWTPRELRHSFVSLMSESGVPVEEIARLAGHSSTRTTEVVYRRELRPVLTRGAEIMDKIFKPSRRIVRRRSAKTGPGSSAARSPETGLGGASR
jgi:integrase